MAHRINKFLIAKGHKVRVILHYYKGEPYIYEGVEVFPSTGHVDAYRWAHLIMTHLDMTQYTITMAREAKRPIVHFVHNDIPYNSIMNSTKRVYSVYNSQWIAKKIGYKMPSFVLPPPCSPEDYAVETSREYITLVSLNERKGGYKLYEIAKAMPDRKFLGVVGSYENTGPLKLTQPEIIAKLMTLSNVTIVPNSPDILATYKRTKILLMPSDYESWGRTATEAMCSGIPVICTPTPGLKENCGDAAVYVGKELEAIQPGDAQVDTGSVEEWVKAIQKVEAEYNKYSLLCRDRAAALNPVADLEKLEQFLLSAAYEH